MVPIPGFPATFAGLPGEELLAPEWAIEGQWPRDARSGRSLEPAELLTAPGARVSLEGWFQRFEFFQADREQIRGEWLAVRNAPPPRPAGDFAICLRTQWNAALTGDESPEEVEAMETAGLLTEDEVRRLVATVRHRRLYLVTNCPEHPLLHALHDLGGEVVAESEMREFLFIRSFQKVAFSQDSLSWWAAFLGGAREIYFPPCRQGFWSHPAPACLPHEPWWHGIDLRVPDEARYIENW